MNEKILVIIPAYNEEKNIASTIEGVKKILPSGDILVINDASEDKTYFIAKKEKVSVLDMPFNVGIGTAMQTGYCYAKEFGYTIAVQFDADGQHHAADILNMLKLINDTDSNKKPDMVIASRFLLQEGFKSSFLRRIGIRYFSFLISVFTNRKITDPTSGFRMINRKLIELFSEQYAEDYPEPESVVLAIKKDFCVIEMPTVMYPRKTGLSSITSFKTIYYMTKVTLGILTLNIKKERQQYGNNQDTRDNNQTLACRELTPGQAIINNQISITKDVL